MSNSNLADSIIIEWLIEHSASTPAERKALNHFMNAKYEEWLSTTANIGIASGVQDFSREKALHDLGPRVKALFPK